MCDLDNLIILPLQKEDLEDVCLIENSMMHNPWTINMFLLGFNERTVGFIVKKDVKIVGYVLGEKIIDEAEIFKIAVLSEFQGQGIGDRLLNIFMEKCLCNGIKKVFLEVSSANENAIKLYKKHGFTENGRRKNYYGKDNDAILFVHYF